jgi:predicted deacylase
MNSGSAQPFRRLNGEALVIAGETIEGGTTRDLQLHYSQSYTGINVTLPVRVVTAEKPGPVVFFTAVVHGDELNGLGISCSITISS